MNVSEQIINVLNTLSEKFGIAIDWTAANVLPYIQDLCGRIVTYSIAKNIIEIICFTIGLIVMIFTFKFFFKKGMADSWCSDHWCYASITSGVIFGMLCIAYIIIIPVDIISIVQACTIPELTIIQMIEELIEMKGA